MQTKAKLVRQVSRAALTAGLSMWMAMAPLGAQAQTKSSHRQPKARPSSMVSKEGSAMAADTSLRPLAWRIGRLREAFDSLDAHVEETSLLLTSVICVLRERTDADSKSLRFELSLSNSRLHDLGFGTAYAYLRAADSLQSIGWSDLAEEYFAQAALKRQTILYQVVDLSWTIDAQYKAAGLLPAPGEPNAVKPPAQNTR